MKTGSFIESRFSSGWSIHSLASPLDLPLLEYPNKAYAEWQSFPFAHIARHTSLDTRVLSGLSGQMSKSGAPSASKCLNMSVLIKGIGPGPKARQTKKQKSSQKH